MSPSQQSIIDQIAEEVKQKLSGEGSGHDWWHIVRVWNTAKAIGTEEKADLFVVELAALLHDIADWKFNNGDETVGPKLAREILEKYSVTTETIDHICNIIASTSFKGAGVKTEMETIEGKVVQDADRLDAIGAIGIARAFATGAKFDEVFHDPNISPATYANPTEYIATKGTKGKTVINHFYEKLLLLKDRMNTETAKNIAQERHQFMEKYLGQFFKEWEGKLQS